jgi:predicted DNA binding protein
VKHLDIVVPTRVLEDVGILTELFFRNNESVDILQSFAVRPTVLALVVRVRRRGPFKDLDAIHREARALVRRYRLARFELMSANRERGEYIAWIEWKIPEAVQEALGTEGGIVPLRVLREDARSARVSLLVSEAVLRRFRSLLDRFGGRDWVRAVRQVPAERWDAGTTLTPRQRELLTLAFRLGYYETPAKVSLDRLGQLVGISRAAFSKHLRSAERKILGTVVGSPG